ncbi:hypothetical protein [Blastopirellula marina]|uniref:Uncharacterized protein n=1 Tax=Blastopirellula marina TaxID=124 RepID=A0A2S8GSR5_9BACT|nr:hypothetical protein [Blastopirellula marina]PQO47463.1 hypothetical protein C5Y93_05320 [Blastopirellula marina]
MKPTEKPKLSLASAAKTKRRRGLSWTTTLVIMALSAVAFLAMGIAGGSVGRGVLAAPFGALCGFVLAVELYQLAHLAKRTAQTVFAPPSKWIWLIGLLVAIGVATPLAYLFDLSMLAIGIVMIASFVATTVVSEVVWTVVRDVCRLFAWCGRWGRAKPAVSKSEQSTS